MDQNKLLLWGKQLKYLFLCLSFFLYRNAALLLESRTLYVKFDTLF